MCCSFQLLDGCVLSLHSLSGLSAQELVSQLLQAVYVGCEACAKPLTQVRDYCNAHFQWNLFKTPDTRSLKNTLINSTHFAVSDTIHVHCNPGHLTILMVFMIENASIHCCLLSWCTGCESCLLPMFWLCDKDTWRYTCTRVRLCVYTCTWKTLSRWAQTSQRSLYSAVSS